MLDTRGVAYATYVHAKDFSTEQAAYMGAQEVIDDWLRTFSGILEAKKPSAVEWRATPEYEVAEVAKDRWRGQVRTRFSLHGSFDPLDSELYTHSEAP